MSYMNRMGNIRNPYQGETKKVLCVCSAGLLRSPTLANVLHEKFGYNTRAVGVSSEYALIPLDDVHVGWADEVVFVHEHVRERFELERNMKDYPNTTFVTLDLEDMYEWDAPALRVQCLEQYNAFDNFKNAEG